MRRVVGRGLRRFGLALALLGAGAPRGLTAVPQEAPRPWSGGVNLVGQGAPSERVRSEASGSVDLFLDLHLGPLWLHAYVEGATGPRAGGVAELLPGANTDAGTALDGDGRGRVQLSELRVAWRAGEAARLHAGLMDLTGYLDVSRIANDENLFFLGAPFVNNPTIAFPDYVLGTVLEAALPGARPTHLVLTVTSSHGPADNPEAGYGQLVDLGAAGKGVFTGLRFRWEEEGWEASLGGWADTSDRGSPEAAGGASWSGGAYSLLELRRPPHDVSLRLGAARGSRGPESFVGTTYLWSRGEDAVGMGFGWTGGVPEVGGFAEHHAELFLRRRLLGRVFLTASGQWLSREALAGAAALGARGFWVLGFRASAAL